jgi:hypothetical protein
MAADSAGQRGSAVSLAGKAKYQAIISSQALSSVTLAFRRSSNRSPFTLHRYSTKRCQRK